MHSTQSRDPKAERSSYTFSTPSSDIEGTLKSPIPNIRLKQNHEDRTSPMPDDEIAAKIAEQISDQPWRNTQFWIGLVLYVGAGSTNPLISKYAYLLDSYPCPPDDDCEARPFDGWVTMCVARYLYQIVLAALTYYVLDYTILYKRNKKPLFSNPTDIRDGKFPRNKKAMLNFFFIALLDVGFNTTSRSAIMMMRVAMGNMLSSLQVIAALLADMLILRRAITVGRAIAVIVIITGVCIFGQSMASAVGDENLAPRPYLGAFLAIVSAFCRGFHSTVQTQFMTAYSIPPFKQVFLESALAMVMMVILATILHFTGVVDLVAEFWMVFRSWELLLTLTIFAIGSFLMNGGGALIGKFVSGLFRMITARSIGFMSYCIELGLGWSPFTWLSGLGWVILFIGVDLYGGVYRGCPNRAKWFFRPILCCKCLVPPPDAILSQKQRQRRGMDSDDGPLTIPIAELTPHDASNEGETDLVYSSSESEKTKARPSQ